MNTKKRYKISQEHKDKISNSLKGKRNAFKSGRITSFNGYIRIYNPISRKYFYEHKLVASKKIGRELLKGETVHHINRNKQDNHPENLAVISSSENIKEHHSYIKKAIEFYEQNH